MAWPVDPAMLPAFLAAMVMVELTPGPNMGYLAALSADRGRMAGFAVVLGITLGLGVYLAASVAGLTELLKVWPPAYEILRWTGVAFLMWLAWEAWRGADPSPDVMDGPARSLAGLVGRGFLANVLNPKAALFYVTVLPTFIVAGRAPAEVQIALFGLGHLLISLTIHGLIVMGAAGAGRLVLRAGGPRMVLVRRIMAVGIGLIALWMAWQTRRG